jgi:hypothetical protein
MGEGYSIAAARQQRMMGGRGKELRQSLYPRADMHVDNNDALSRNTHTDIKREHLLVIICRVESFGAFLQ